LVKNRDCIHNLESARQLVDCRQPLPNRVASGLPGKFKRFDEWRCSCNLRLEYYWRYSLRWPAVGGVMRGMLAGLAGKEVAFLP
jgi:hypothetical protein